MKKFAGIVSNIYRENRKDGIIESIIEIYLIKCSMRDNEGKKKGRELALI